MSGEARSSSCLAKGTRRHFRKFCAFARFVRRDVIMAMIIGSAKSDVFTSPSWGWYFDAKIGPFMQILVFHMNVRGNFG